MRLRRSVCDGPGFSRVRRGRGFAYLDEHGERLTARDHLDRLRALVIPPAWQRVWICPFPNGHIQAVGFDEAGRKQYIYHEQWRRDRDGEKHDRVLELARRLPGIRDRIQTDLTATGLGRDRVVAGALRILDRGVFRTGGEEYAEEHDSRGVATLLCEHVRLRSGELRFRFPAKSGIERVAAIRDPELAALVTALRRGRADDDRLFVYRVGKRLHELKADEVRERFKGFAGERFTVKDMRTWTATVLAAVEFAARERPGSTTATKRAEAEVMRAVAEQLGNTPAVARRSYVDPRVPELFRDGHTIEATLRRIGDHDRDQLDIRGTLERAVVRLLRSV
ncbi:MAG: DNA topoisomerase IB [Actinomycetota bacterium]|nr:DNA topoisomerase IB [Actinomycetota bacterium]